MKKSNIFKELHRKKATVNQFGGDIVWTRLVITNKLLHIATVSLCILIPSPLILSTYSLIMNSLFSHPNICIPWHTFPNVFVETKWAYERSAVAFAPCHQLSSTSVPSRRLRSSAGKTGYRCSTFFAFVHLCL